MRINPFKIGDRIICIKKPYPDHYQCKVGVKATIIAINGTKIHTKENICTDLNIIGACYQHIFFKLIPKISFKTIN